MNAPSAVLNEPVDLGPGEMGRIREEWLKLVAINARIEPEPPALICNADGTHHYSEIKKLADSGKQYIYAVNNPIKPTTAMLIGTAVHFLVLGARTGAKPLVRYSGDTRRGKAWEAFEAENDGADILTAPEWSKAERIAEAVMLDPVAQARLAGARFEVPVRWEEPGGIICSTSGIDIVCAQAICDLKATFTTQLDAWQRHAFRMLYPQQMAWYRRGARANGLDTSHGLFILGVETKAPYEVVELELTEPMIEFADRTIDLWLGMLRTYRSSREWPGRAQLPVPFELPSWVADEDDDEESGDEEHITLIAPN